MRWWLRVALYVVAGAIGIAGAASGISKAATLLLIAVVVFPVVMLDIRYKRLHGDDRNA